MTFNEYQSMAMETAVYPEVLSNAPYAGLGLCGEVGELCSLVILKPKMKRGEFLKSVRKESGDVTWYGAAAAAEAGLELEEIKERYNWHKGQKTAEPCWMMALGAAKVAETFKKVVRDKDGEFTDSCREKVKDGLGMVFAGVRVLGGSYAISIEEIFEENGRKLGKREEQGKLQGEGSDREEEKETEEEPLTTNQRGNGEGGGPEVEQQEG